MKTTSLKITFNDNTTKTISYLNDFCWIDFEPSNSVLVIDKVTFDEEKDTDSKKLISTIHIPLQNIKEYEATNKDLDDICLDLFDHNKHNFFKRLGKYLHLNINFSDKEVEFDINIRNINNKMLLDTKEHKEKFFKEVFNFKKSDIFKFHEENEIEFINEYFEKIPGILLEANRKNFIEVSKIEFLKTPEKYIVFDFASLNHYTFFVII